LNGMRIKSFFAASVDAALAEARRELGPEAMLVQSRPAPAEARALGDYEVVCALLPSETGDTKTPLPSTPGDRAGNASDVRKLTSELDALRDTVARLQSVIVSNQISPIRTPPQFESIRVALADAELHPSLIGDLIDRAAAEQSDQSPFTPEQLLARQLTSIIAADASVDAGQTAIALVGPPGAGKTSCIAKLAARCGVAARRSTEILSLDEHRVAASEQLRAYASILGVGFRLISDRTELPHVLDECRRKNLVLIDTPGFSFAEAEACRELAAAFRARSSVQVQLVLPCSMRAADLRRAAEFYEAFPVRRLIFTRLDETAAYGHMINESVRQKKPISFLGTGPVIPDDIEPADPVRIADLVLKARSTPAWAAAAAV